MKDTPQHIKQLQLKLWLSKPPMERLRQMMADNEALYKFWNNTKSTTITLKDSGINSGNSLKHE